MSGKLESKLPNADMQRAARRAREVAFRTGTRLVIVRDGVIVREVVTEKDLDVPEES